MIECVVFDADGTLINTEKEIIQSLQRIVREELGKEMFALSMHKGNIKLS